MPDTQFIAVDIGCPCHDKKQDPECSGAMRFIFTRSMFDAGNESEFEQQWKSAVSGFCEIFDGYYEQVRARLNADDCGARPKRDFMVVVSLNSATVAAE